VNCTIHKVELDLFIDISTDSADDRRRELFIPITERIFDGHLFIGGHLKDHARRALCERKRQDICVSSWVQLFSSMIPTQPSWTLPVIAPQALHDCIAITGSNGKNNNKRILVHMIKGHSSVHYNEKIIITSSGVSKKHSRD